MAENAHRLTAELDQWLRGGGWVVTSSERAARFVAAEFNRARRAEGLTVWQDPTILTWSAYVRELWRICSEQLRPFDSRMILSPAQEIALWETILSASGAHAAILGGPRHHLAALARDAHELLAGHAPQALDASQRSGWQNDSEQMSKWLTEFDAHCARGEMLSAARMPLKLLTAIQKFPDLVHTLAPVKIIGFDRLKPAQLALLNAIGKWQVADLHVPATRVNYYRTADGTAELKACVLWCGEQLTENPSARLLVISNDIANRRGEFERAFARGLHTPHSPAIEFSLGVPLASIPLVRAARLLARWLTTPLEEAQLDWLFASEFASTTESETAALCNWMRELRHRQWQRPDWRLRNFLALARSSRPALLDWHRRLTAAQTLLDERNANRRCAPREWAAFHLEVLDAIGWPGNPVLTSANFQAGQRFEQLIEATAELGFDNRKLSWGEYQLLLDQQLVETLFAAESREAPILIAGPAESAGLSADGIWMLGAEEGSWPASGSTNPLLPLSLQRAAAMPHSTAADDWQLARQMTERILNSAPVLCFSCASLRNAQEMKPSRLIEQHAGPPQSPPPNLLSAVREEVDVETFDENRLIPFTTQAVRGGANLLSEQSQCPFKAFALRRLNAQGWDAASPGFTPLEKGNLLHAVMRGIWSGEESGGLDGLNALLALREGSNGRNELEDFVRQHVREQTKRGVNASMRERIPPQVIELEEERLTLIITEWMLYESSRIGFEVIAREQKYTAHFAGLTLNLRIDRIDKLRDDSLLVIDYKSGMASRNEWRLPRPENIQLPLYASVAAEAISEEGATSSRALIGGLAFARISAGSICFDGRLREAKKQLISTIDGRNPLAKMPLTEDALELWKSAIEKLACDFLAGDAAVNPADAEKTCGQCDLQVLCRRQEVVVLAEDSKDEIDDAEGSAGHEDE